MTLIKHFLFRFLPLLSLLFLAVSGVFAESAETFDLTILHTNDVHARVAQFSESGSRCTPADAAEDRCYGGVARRATIIQQVRREVDNVLLLDSGDQFQGTLFYTRYKGEEAQRFMNLLGYDAMAVGNHEFDDGPQALAAFIRGADFPILSANIDTSDEPSLAGLIRPYTILDIGGEKIGVVGYTTEDTAILSSPGPGVRFLNVEITVQAAVSEMEAMGINKIIAISHAGFARDQQVAATVRGLDVIIAGHTHTYLSNTDPNAEGPYPTVVDASDGTPVLLVSDFAWGKYLGRLNVTFDEKGIPVAWDGNPILLDASVRQDPVFLVQVEALNEPLQALMEEPLGTTDLLLNGDRSACRSNECTMGNLIADAILWFTASEGIQIVIINGGSIRTSIPAGEVSLDDILEVLPSSNSIATFELSGNDIREALENGVSRANSAQNEGTGRFPQVAGLRYTWNSDNLPGSRIETIEIRQPDGRFTPMDPAAIYQVATNDFLRRGGDGYTVFADNAINPYDSGANLEEAVAAYVTAHAPLSIQIDGRINQVQTEANPYFATALLMAAAVFGFAGIMVLARRD